MDEKKREYNKKYYQNVTKPRKQAQMKEYNQLKEIVKNDTLKDKEIERLKEINNELRDLYEFMRDKCRLLEEKLDSIKDDKINDNGYQ